MALLLGLSTQRWTLVMILVVLTGSGFVLLPLASAGPAARESGDQGAGMGCPAVPPTPFFTIAYGTVQVDGQPAPVGSVVRAMTPRGSTAGCCEVKTAGHYGAMFVYGEDTTITPPIPGMRQGEVVAFRVGERTADASPPLVWDSDSEFHEVSLTTGPAEVCYTLSTNASPASGGSVEADTEPNCTGDGTKYAAGTQVRLTANPARGYSFVFWSGDAAGSANPTTVTMDGDRSVTANFSQQCYTLTTSASPAGGGSVEMDIAPNCAGDGTKYAAGTQVQLTGTPAQSYSFTFWSGDAGGSANPTTVTMDGERSVAANFSQQCYTLTTSTSPAAGGSVQADIAPNCSGDETRYAAGSQVELTAIPARGYLFARWNGDVAGAANPTSVTIDGDKAATAYFQEGYWSYLALVRR